MSGTEINNNEKPMATPWFNQGVTIMGPAGYFVAETQINREHARVDTYLALANAAHIVLCVNAHDELVAFVESIANNPRLAAVPGSAKRRAQELLKSISKSGTSTEGGAR